MACTFLVSIFTLYPAGFPQSHSFLNICKLYAFMTQFCSHVMIACPMFRFGWLVYKEYSTKSLLLPNQQQQKAVEGRFSVFNKFVFSCISWESTYLNSRKANLLHISPIFANGFASVLLVLITCPNQTFIFANTCQNCYIVSNVITVFSLCWAALLFLTQMTVALRIQDNFKIGTELRMLIIVTIAIIIYQIVYLIYPNAYSRKLALGIFYVIFICVQSVYPVMLSFQHEYETRHHGVALGKRDHVKDLKRCIADRKVRDMFLKFLESELSVENLTFYEAVEELGKLVVEDGENIRKIVDKVEYIMKTFIRNSATSPVNLSYPTRNELLNEVKGDLFVVCARPNVHLLFLRAQTEVLNLMASDPFFRFRVKHQDILKKKIYSRASDDIFRPSSGDHPDKTVSSILETDSKL
eukprot:TRINITY_DN29188_c0_g1_i3.p1 TRINITY_DN29188_c0_g1~~TRINITY_DN29188_c0_g1_i3.p1  ORF type:complete len:411 (-),score=66.29 TRINITY_DN29188_c0_g1_i3:1501-2733(-)